MTSAMAQTGLSGPLGPSPGTLPPATVPPATLPPYHHGLHGSRRLHQGCPVPSPWVCTRLAQRRGASTELSSF